MDERLARKREWQRKYYAANREKELERLKQHRAANPHRAGEAQRRWQRENRHKANAQQQAWRAAERGDLERESCLFCDEPKVEAHHHDYDQPLEVTWLCRYHHRVIHRRSSSSNQSLTADRDPLIPSAGATQTEPVNRASLLSEDLDEYKGT